MKRLASFITISFLLLSLLGTARQVFADTVTLRVSTTDTTADYSSIQDALNAAYTSAQQYPANSYSVLVEPGTYPGPITFPVTAQNNIQLSGRETRTTVIDGGGGAGITVSGVGGTIKNFSIVNASIGIDVSGNAPITISNNVFNGRGSGIGVRVQNTQSTIVLISNNTFLQNSTAINRDSESVQITSNIFWSNTSNIVNASSLVSQNNISFNDFSPADSTGLVGTSSIPNTTYTNPDPLFVDAANGDFHLTASSPCIGTGNPASPNAVSAPTSTTNNSDMGAYGGQNMDTIPAPVASPTSTVNDTEPYAITLSWTANPDYRVKGYRVYYGHTSRNNGGTYDGTDAVDASGVPLDSPVDAGDTTTFTLGGITPTSLPTTTPDAPELYQPQPQNESLIVSWSTVSGANDYHVYYGIASPTENVLDAGNNSSATIPNLTNGTTYIIAVSALVQNAYYLAVTSYYENGSTALAPGTSYESVYSPELSVAFGPSSESPLSSTKYGIPETIIPYPSLPNKGCFIATAAYGSINDWPVRVLRSFRDRFLLASTPGRAFVRFYYETSPPIAAFIRDRAWLRFIVRVLLGPLVFAALCMLHPAAASTGAFLTAFVLWGIHSRRRRMHAAHSPH